MNRIYKVIWSKVKHQYVVVSELAHRDGKRSKSIVCSTAALLAVFALTAGVGVAPVWAVNTADATTELIDSNYSAYLDKENTITNSEDTYVVGNGNIIDNFVEGMVIGNGNKLSSNGSDNLIIGNDNAGSGQVLNNSIVLGSHNVWEAAASDNIFIGNNININLNTTRSNGSNTVVVGHDVTADPMVSALGDEITASWGASVMGYKASSEDNSVSIGHLANADAAQTVAIGYGAKSRSGYGAAIGAFAEVGSNSYGLALGGYSRVGNSAMKSIAIGTSGRGYTEGRTEVKDGASYSIAMGGKTTVGENAEQSVAIGGYQAIVGDNAKYSTAIGTFSDIAANVEHGTAVGYNTNVDANYGTALGNGASANGEWSTALGASTDAKQQATAVGSNAQALAGNSVAVGVNSSVAEGADYSVALGTSSKVEEGDAFTTTDLEDFKKKLGDTYNAAWNITSADGTLGVVSVGAKGKERRLVNVARGRIDADSTDAVNGSQLYGLASDLNEKIENAGGDWVLTTNGGTSPGEQTTIGKGNTVDFTGAKDAETEHQNIQVSQAQVKDGKGNVIGTDVSLDLNDRVELGTGADQVVIDATTGKGSIAVGDKVLMSATGAANFGNIELNSEGQGNPQHVSTITGLTNTEWNQTGTYNAGRAATEEQLQDAIGEVNENAYKGWNVTANGNVEGSKTISSGNTVDFAGQTDENGHSNVVVSKEDTKDGTNLKFDLNDKVVLGDDKDSQIVLDGTTGNVSIGNVSVDNGTGISFMADGSATFGRIQINKENGSTIIGLTNTTWEPNGTYNAGRAATEEQLKAVSDKVGEVSVEAGKHTTVSVGKNMTVDETDADGQKDYKVMLNDDLYLGDVNQGSGAYVNVFGSTAQIMLGKGSAAPIVIDGGTGTISGLSNLEWNYNSYLAGTYDGSTLAATESQLHDAFGYLDDKINNISITGDDNINVSKPADGEGGTETPGTGSTSPSFDITMSDNPQFGGHADDGQGHAANGSVTVVGTGTDGTAHKVVVDGATGTVSGLSNTEWDWNKYGKPAEEGGYAGSTNAATESQLQGALEGTVQYDRDENGNVDKTNVTLNKGGDSVTIHNVAAGTADTDAVNVSQLNQAWDQINNNTTAITNIGNKVGELDSRIDEVGAGAAALAALHPLDFDPDDKWDFSAGYGNYRGENAVAIGAFYRPNEDTMFSVGGTVGNGDNMVNAGVSFKIGQGNNVSTSRVAMAKEIKSMRDIVAKQDAQIQKLTAMVNALVGMEAIAPDTTTMFPDVPENHWAYEAVEMMAKTGLVQGYPDGEFKGDRIMTRYEFAQIVYNAIQAGIKVDERLVQEFRPELEYFRIDTISKDKDGNPVIQRVRANEIPATK